VKYLNADTRPRPYPILAAEDTPSDNPSAIVITSDLHVVSEAKVDFDGDFGTKYGITKGVHVIEETGEVYAPVAMWLEALNLVLDRLKEKTPLERIRGISGSCQQHGSVWWSREAEALLGGLDAGKTLVEQLEPAFSYTFAPNWQDHSTQAECDQFDAVFGSAKALAEHTGSGAHHVSPHFLYKPETRASDVESKEDLLGDLLGVEGD
jgi:xylulokinase